MGKHAGARAEGGRRGSLVLTTGAALLTIAAWVVLVTYAIRLGAVVRAGGATAAWTLMIVATLGAVCCLFLGLVLGGRLVALVRGSSAGAPAATIVRLPGGRRARR